MASTFNTLCGRVRRRPFPAFKFHPLAYRQPVYCFGKHLSFEPTGTPLHIPPFTHALDWELALGDVRCKPLCNATPQEALDAIGGFVMVKDSSACDIQRAEMATGLGPKRASTSAMPCPTRAVGAADVLGRVEQLQAHVDINGQTVASTSTTNMLNTWGETLSVLSTQEPLRPRELIAAGTLPFGTGTESGRWLQAGNTLRLVIEGLDALRPNTFVWMVPNGSWDLHFMQEELSHSACVIDAAPIRHVVNTHTEGDCMVLVPEHGALATPACTLYREWEVPTSTLPGPLGTLDHFRQQASLCV